MIKALVQIATVAGVLLFLPTIVPGLVVSGFIPALEVGVVLFVVIRVLAAIF